MAQRNITCTIDVNRGKAFDELAENCADLQELIDLIPEWQKPGANKIAQRIADRQTGWVTLNGK